MISIARGKSGPAISAPADSASKIVKFTISIPRESCTNAKAKYSSSVVLPDPSVHFYHCLQHSTKEAYTITKRDDILSAIKAYMSQINLQHGTTTVENRKTTK